MVPPSRRPMPVELAEKPRSVLRPVVHDVDGSFLSFTTGEQAFCNGADLRFGVFFSVSVLCAYLARNEGYLLCGALAGNPQGAVEARVELMDSRPECIESRIDFPG